jgi:hypothetical protein
MDVNGSVVQLIIPTDLSPTLQDALEKWADDHSVSSGNMPLADICAPRGSDFFPFECRPSSVGAENRATLPAWIAFPSTPHTWMDPKLGRRQEPSYTFLGGAPPQKQDSDKAKSKGQAQSEGKGKGKAPNMLESISADPQTIKVVFASDTQTPHIQLITARRPGTEEGPRQLISKRLYFTNIRCVEDPDHAKTSFGDLELRSTFVPSDLAQCRHNPGTLTAQGVSTLRQLATDGYLIQIRIGLKGMEDDWEGLTDRELADYKSRSQADSVRDKTMTRDSLIQGLCNTRFPKNLLIFVRISKNELPIWEKMVNYMGRLFGTANRWGNFWFYRMTTHEAGFEGGAIDNTKALPKCDFNPPVWMVTKWQATKSTVSNSVTYSNLRPLEWTKHRTPLSYPFPSELSFLTMLSIKQETDCNMRNLNTLVRPKNRWFRGVFYAAPGSSNKVIVEVFMAPDESQEAKGDRLIVNMPPKGTRVRIEADVKNPLHPSKTGAIKFNCITGFDPLGHDASFLCTGTGPVSKLRLIGNQGKEFPVFLAFIFDNTTSERQMRGICDLAQIDSNNKPTGVDGKALILGCNKPANESGWLAHQVDDKMRETFQNHVTRAWPKPNKDQREAIMNTLNGETGATIIKGPPGTGKTEVIVCIGNGHGKIGRKVLYVAPTNDAILNVYEKFDKINEIVLSGKWAWEQYVHFTGATVSIEAAERLKASQEEFNNDAAAVELQLIEADGLKDPRFHWTFGWKLKAMIDRWAKDSSTTTPELHSHAKDYMDDQNSLPTLYDREDREKCKSRMQKLESILGRAYLKKHVKFLFTTSSMAAHPTVIEGFQFPLIIIDDAACEYLSGIAILFSRFKHCLKHAVFVCDPKQGEASYASGKCNVGLDRLSLDILNATVEDRYSRYDIFMLKECYRMSQPLLNWSSQHFYGGLLKAHPTVANYDRPGKNTEALFWSSLRRIGQGGPWDQASICVTGFEVAHRKEPGTTTKVNDAEADVIAYIIKKMLAFEPPESDPINPSKQYRPLTPEDFGVVTPYAGQVTRIKNQLRVKEPDVLTLSDEDVAKILVASVKNIQGKERNIMFFSTVVNPGKPRLRQNDWLPIGFVAELKNLNIALTRQRNSRHIVGNLQTFHQAKLDRHPIIHKFSPFFDLVQHLRHSDNITTLGELLYYRENRKPIEDRSRAIQWFKTAGYDQPDIKAPAPTTGTSSSKAVMNTRTTVTHRNPFAAETQGPKSPGNRNEAGQLQVQHVGKPGNQTTPKGGKGQGNKG